MADEQMNLGGAADDEKPKRGKRAEDPAVATAPASEPKNETPAQATETPRPAAQTFAQGTPLARVELEPEGTIGVYSNQASFVAAQRMAQSLAASSLVPEAYRGPSGVANCLIAMELAGRCGASVFMVMQNLDIIHGRPGWRSQFLIATVNASGRFTPLRFQWEGKPGSDEWGCRAVAKDRRSGDECVGALITISLAKSEGWYARNGSKWKTMPEQMLMYRAGSFWTRVYCPEIALGIQTGDEIVDTYGEVVPETPSALRPGSASSLESALLGHD